MVPWIATTLGDLAEKGVLCIKNGYAQGTYNQDGEGLPHLRPFNISTNGQIDLSQIKYVTPPDTDSPYWVYPKDVVFDNTNSEELVGKTAFFKDQGDYALSNHMTIIRVSNLPRSNNLVFCIIGVIISISTNLFIAYLLYWTVLRQPI